MERAVLFSGDGDFAPLVEALVEMGIHVEVAADRRTVADELKRAADEFCSLALAEYSNFWLPEFRNKFPVPQQSAFLS